MTFEKPSFAPANSDSNSYEGPTLVVDNEVNPNESAISLDEQLKEFTGNVESASTVEEIIELVSNIIESAEGEVVKIDESGVFTELNKGTLDSISAFYRAMKDKDGDKHSAYDHQDYIPASVAVRITELLGIVEVISDKFERGKEVTSFFEKRAAEANTIEKLEAVINEAEEHAVKLGAKAYTNNEPSYYEGDNLIALNTEQIIASMHTYYKHLKGLDEGLNTRGNLPTAIAEKVEELFAHESEG